MQGNQYNATARTEQKPLNDNASENLKNTQECCSLLDLTKNACCALSILGILAASGGICNAIQKNSTGKINTAFYALGFVFWLGFGALALSSVATSLHSCCCEGKDQNLYK